MYNSFGPFRQVPGAFSNLYNRRRDKDVYWDTLSDVFGGPMGLPAAATEAAIRGATPLMNQSAGVTDDAIRGGYPMGPVPDAFAANYIRNAITPLPGQGTGMFYNALLGS